MYPCVYSVCYSSKKYTHTLIANKYARILRISHLSLRSSLRSSLHSKVSGATLPGWEGGIIFAAACGQTERVRVLLSEGGNDREAHGSTPTTPTLSTASSTSGSASGRTPQGQEQAGKVGGAAGGIEGDVGGVSVGDAGDAGGVAGRGGVETGAGACGGMEARSGVCGGVNYVTSDGQTAMRVAREGGHGEIVAMLEAAGAKE